MNDRLSPEGLRYAQAVARTGSFSAAVTITYEAAWDGTSPIASELEALAGLLAV